VRARPAIFVRRVLALFGLLGVLCLFHVWLRLQVTAIGYELSEARQMKMRLEHDRQQLEVELTMLKNRSRLRDLARRRLGMVERSEGQIVELEL
jgi:cell division protein FtsL